MQHTGERELDELRVRVWSGSGEWTLYEDDGSSFAYRDGIYATTTYRVSQDGQRTVVEVDARAGEWTPPQRQAIVEVVGVGEQTFADDGNARRLEF
jgi:alpha-glucosidase